MRWLSEAHPVTPLSGLPVSSSTLHVTAEQQVTADQVHDAKERHLTNRAADCMFVFVSGHSSVSDGLGSCSSRRWLRRSSGNAV